MMPTQHDDRKHAEFSPSNTHRWLACPGSIEMSRGMPNKDSDASREGTRAHEYLEKILNQEMTVADLPEDDDHMTIGLDVAEEYINGLAAHHTDDYQELIEEQVDLQHLGGDCWGTLDYAIWSSTGLEIVDFKFGRHPVEVDNNDQLLTYMIGICEEVGYDFPEFRMTILQPRAAHVKGFIRTATTNVNRLKVYKKKLEAGIKAVKSGESMLAAGPHCQYCRGAGRCPEIILETQAMAKTEFSNFAPTPAKQLDDATLAMVVDNAAALAGWLDSVKDEALRRSKAGQTLPGLKVVRKISRSRWIPEKYELLVADLNPEDRYKQSPYTITEMRRIVKLYDMSEEDINRCTEKPVGDLVVVSDTDGRIEYISPAAEFKGKRIK